MRTRTSPTEPAREDRLERLLRGGDGLASGSPSPDADRPTGESREPVSPWVVGGTVAGDHDLDDHTVRGRHRAEAVPLLSVPESLRSAELGVPMRAVRGLLVLVVVAVLVLGARWWWVQRTAEASPTDIVRTSSEGGATAVDPGAPTEAEAGAEDDAAGPGPGSPDTLTRPAEGAEVGAAKTEAVTERLVVHVAGQVLEPGVVTVPAGSRVVDALRAAGGIAEEGDESALNLARLLVDGERVWVGRPGETPPVAPGPLPSATGGAGTSGGAAAGQGVPLDLNAATQADLEELPGVGPVTAGHILAWREEHARFSSVDELLEVSGIGERTLAQLEPLVSVGG